MDAPVLNQLIELPDTDYNADREAVRKSWLDRIARSPSHLRAYLDGLATEDAENETLAFGRLAHCFVLEADFIDSRYYREPEVDRRTNVGKAQLAEAAAKNEGKKGIRASNWDLGINVRDAVFAHRGARTVLGVDGPFESSMFWMNQECGQLCKARFDKISMSKAFIADVKTTLDASPEGFSRSLWNYAYDRQVAHYSEPTGLRFVFICVEKSPPHAVAVYAASDEVLRMGITRRIGPLRRYVECRERGVWPGYSETESIQRIELPRWARAA